MNSALLWLICNLISIVFLAFYSMMEMACVSFNKVRLQYYVTKGYKRALWLNYLLQHPSRLFGTTLIGVNIALVVGSECARQFYSAIGTSPDLAPLTQVILVVIFGELAPMFAARHYAEHVAMLGVPLVYASARIMTPMLWIVEIISRTCNFLMGGSKKGSDIYLTQEELLNVLEGDETSQDRDSVEFSAVAANIFSLRKKDIRQIMEPLAASKALPSNATVKQMREVLAKIDVDYIPIYSHEISNIIGIVYPQEVMRAVDTRRVRDYAKPPWFVSEKATLLQILKQFRINNESAAVVLSHNGKAIGLLNRDAVLEEIFGKIPFNKSTLPGKLTKLMLIEKTFSGETTVGDFNFQFGIMLNEDPSLTLSELIIEQLGHRPEKGESIYIAPFELSVKEISLLGVKTVSISTRM